MMKTCKVDMREMPLSVGIGGGTEYPGHSVNPLRTKPNLFYLKTQSARHSKHSISVIKLKRYYCV